jgi:glycine reductase complex component B subunit gamma
MTEPLRVVHYLNQFFGGIGGEEHADVGVSVRAEPVGPGRVLQSALGEDARVIATIVCGDNHIAERGEEAVEAIRRELARLKVDVLVAGPAFGSGRYGLACALACRAAAALGIPAVTGMHPENPAVEAHRAEVLIVPTGDSAMAMQPAAQALARFALRLGRREEIGPAEIEGYVSQGRRRVWDRGRPGYQRALDMLRDKLAGRPFLSEVPFRAPDRVPPAKPIADLRRATIAMVTTGGLVRKGNPDRQVAANATRYHRHSVKDLEALTPEGWEAYHAGYFNHIVNKNPNYILPLSFLRDLEAKGTIGRVHDQMYALPGVSTPVAMARALGSSIGTDLREARVDGVLLVAT